MSAEDELPPNILLMNIRAVGGGMPDCRHACFCTDQPGESGAVFALPPCAARPEG